MVACSPTTVGRAGIHEQRHFHHNMVFIQPNWVGAAPPGTTKTGDKHHWPQKNLPPLPSPTTQMMNFASGLHNMISSACTRQRDQSRWIHESDNFNNLRDVAVSSTRRPTSHQRPTLRQSSSSWKRKAIVAWKDGTGALRDRINRGRNSYVPSGFEMVASRFSWIHIHAR